MTSVIFPGQGSQSIGMAKDFYDNFKVAKETFEEIEDYVEMNLKNIIFENNNEFLNSTKYTQISIFTASVAIFNVFIKESDFNPLSFDVMMGHSLGEYTALACSKKLPLKDCSLILKKRGLLMNDAVEQNKSGMAAIIGLDAESVQKIIDDNKIDLEIANDNSPIQVVISGDIEEINKNKKIFLENSIKKFILLNVSSAFHSKYMKNAEKQLSKEIDKLNFTNNKIKIISNYDSVISDNNSTIVNSLKNQMSNQVLWTKNVKKLEEIGEKKIIEIGPGKVLSGLVKRISNNFDIKSINQISDIIND